MAGCFMCARMTLIDRRTVLTACGPTSRNNNDLDNIDIDFDGYLFGWSGQGASSKTLAESPMTHHHYPPHGPLQNDGNTTRTSGHYEGYFTKQVAITRVTSQSKSMATQQEQVAITRVTSQSKLHNQLPQLHEIAIAVPSGPTSLGMRLRLGLASLPPRRLARNLPPGTRQTTHV